MRSTVEPTDDAFTPAAIGRLLKTRRIQLEITLTEAARRADMTEAQFSRLEHGRGNPSVSTISRAMKGLGMTLQDLAGGGDVTARIVHRGRPANAVDWEAINSG